MSDVSVLGSGRWGSFIAWYLNKVKHKVTLWGKAETKEISTLIKNRNNGVVFFEEKIKITSGLESALRSEYIIISINAQNLRSFFVDLVGDIYVKNGFFKILAKKKIILCMKGIEKDSGKRLTEIVKEFLPENDNVAIWVGPGHVMSLMSGVPTCMVIDSTNENYKKELLKLFTSNLIKCFCGVDLVGNEIGAAAKNVLGIAAGILDALGMQALKGALMARGSLEISKLISALGGKKESAYGLCHLGDYEATLFSKESNNRRYGETIVTEESVDFVAEGVGTSEAINNLSEKYNLNLPICKEIYRIVNSISTPKESIRKLFSIESEYEI
ncbi:MAG: NAD(P)H-dependent glycerol-3-phosphate dehydrogenase [Candidatus Improbicoccus pseudotrichonymphae]|uniref:Glycerol-3-phosphate dehydrogenase n=1 Tax=Candidatus Improbicoccus pseudotrichonymphae TaxID=3033792 RepID=A0AA48KYH3_9FIRM|nr:MAG: NAD(P)H-dependent glycerol-3-phosphate dehydrogenase [Candidatus Improbicoccus pseudotrichonymphae]